MDVTVKIKEKKNSYNCKIKVSKESIADYQSSPEGLAEFKKDFLNIIALEIDTFIVENTDEDNSDRVIEALESVEITQKELETETNEAE